MGASIWIKEMEFNDGTILNFSKNDIVVLVGPNNAGKSASLKEANKLIKNTADKSIKILKQLKIEKEGTTEELEQFISLHSVKKSLGSPQPHLQGFGFSVYSESLKYTWPSQTGVGELTPVFVNILNTEQRLLAANPPQNIRLTTDGIQHPIHLLQRDDNLESQFSDYFHQAFGTDLIVHRNAGSEVPLYVGAKPIPNPGEDRVSSSYLKELEKLDLLQEQGDGMRSFVGVLLNAFISNHSILFIDEPEAFLHPPQARLLGKMLAKNLPAERQLFLATHSESFLKGLLDSNASNLKIIRIQRNGSINPVSILNTSDINNVWNDSLLRHSNVLDGLFHSKVAICESDSDSRFFSAILASLFDKTGDIVPDILFINCGGKHRIPTAVKALRHLNVPTKVIADFDVLNELNPLKTIFEDLGGNWPSVENDWKIVKNEIEQKRPEFLTEDAKKEIEKILSQITERIFPKRNAVEIQKVLKKVSAWSEAKEVGKAFIPSGNGTQAFDRLQIEFKNVGLLIPEVGELEGFVRSVGNHGPKWVAEVLSKDLRTDPELELARKFVLDILK